MIGSGAKRKRATAGDTERRYFRAAIASVLALIVLFYAAFVKHLPFESQFVMRGVFSSANQLEPGSLVRIAGINIGKVAGVGPGPSNTSVVTMDISNPSELHADTSLAIEPRLLFEGNFYVKVNPGTPAAPPMRSGATVPLTRTTVPVQLDQVLDLLTLPTRDSLRSTITQLAAGLGAPSPSTAGPAGYSGLRTAVQQLDASLASVTQVATAAQGTEPGDLQRTIGSSADLTAQLASDPAALADIIASFNSVAGALANHDQQLAQSVVALDHVLHVAPASLTAVDGALPPLKRFAVALRPGLEAAPSALNATNDLLGQIGRLVSTPELPGLLRTLAPVTNALPTLEHQLNVAAPLITPVSQCLSRNIVPTLDQTLQDGANSTGRPAWQDLLHMATGLSGASPAFDGNGTTIRLGVTQGDQALVGLLPNIGQVAGTTQIEGLRPTWLGAGVLPAYRPDQPCTAQPLPNVNMDSATIAPDWLKPELVPNRRSALQARIIAGLLGGSAGRQRLLDQLLSELATPAPTARHDHAKRPHPTSSDTTANSASSTPSTTTTSTSTTSTAQPPTSIASTLTGVLQKLLGGTATALGGKGTGQ